MKVLNPLRPKFPIKVLSKEEYEQKSEELFKRGYKSYASNPINLCVPWHRNDLYLEIFYDEIGLTIGRKIL